MRLEITTRQRGGAGQGSARNVQRGAWNAEKWKSWYANISLREQQKEKALAMLQEADKQKQIVSKKAYPELFKKTTEGLDILEKCAEMCSPDDPEDVHTFESLQKKYMTNKDLFFKHQEFEERKK